MSYIEFGKVFVDIVLVASMVYLAWRYTRPGSSLDDSRVKQLAESMRELIREAEESSRTLGDQLLRRQHAMEKLLHEIQSSENKAQSSIKIIDAKKAELEKEIHKAALILRSSLSSSSARRSEPVETVSESDEPLPRNGYVAPVSSAPIVRRSLAQEVEKEVFVDGYEEPLEQVMAKAEQVSVAMADAQRRARPVLSKLEDNKDRLHSMRSAVERWEATRVASEERGVVEESAGDPRLGVLGSMRRQATAV